MKAVILVISYYGWVGGGGKHLLLEQGAFIGRGGLLGNVVGY